MVRGAQQYVQRAQSNPASVECAEQTGLIHEGSTSQLTALKGSAANIEVPDTTEHLPAGSSSWWVRVVLATDCDPSECYYLKFEYFHVGSKYILFNEYSLFHGLCFCQCVYASTEK